ncbi:MAG TPA: hypothetical protein VEC11_02325 [Allosphingosinicella sp.]|nr:hypothetical protein [Allosphingosinicella sp.]
MSGRNTSTRVMADHCRELALWTSDERTHHILMEMARELETEDGEKPAPASAPPPRSLS